ncbi:hypothetical protein VD0004_g3511 [Verticillium dahliae]|uniref:Restriction of telomere capping protein 4 n=1 Tax=Verticillium dahliae TaxID=27337 RepID=A0A444S3T5_VERDA|nr:hypothetical protein VD0004_g3511 [Verticillium dahliae]PNH74108.1 hypothetical protein VD0001_g3452 [Verticillium dahliae]RXG48066.1 hypothetical protein VDGE_04510 [Verticillium dahliae]
MHFERRAPGLTARGVKPLLSQVNGKKVERAPRRKPEPIETPEDIYAAPLSSSCDESSDTMSAGGDRSPKRDASPQAEARRGRSAGASQDWKHSGFDSDSDDGPAARGDIKATKFHGDRGRTTAGGGRDGSRQGPLRSRDANLKSKSAAGRKRGHANMSDDADVPAERSAKRRASSPREQGTGGRHLEDVFHQTKVKASQRKYGERGTTKQTGLGAKSTTPEASLSSSPNESRRKTSYRAPDALPMSPSGEDSERIPKRRSSRFKEPDSLPTSPDDKPVVKNGYKKCAPLPRDTSPKRPTYKKPELLPGKSAPAPRQNDLSVPYVPPQGKPAIRIPGRRKKAKRAEALPEPKVFVAGSTFRLPASLPGMGLDDLLGGPYEAASPGTLSLASDDDDANEEEDEEEDSNARPTGATPTKCPMCDLAVDEDLLRTFSKGRPLSISQQIKFCRLHNAKTARATWLAKGYPDIDWEALPSRFAAHDGALRRIVHGDASHYRSVLAGRVSDGRERTLRATERSLAPGYYGPRGLRVMSEHLISRFASALRRRAVEDELVAARGSAVFVSTVLVPELASRLIMEDLAVGADEAHRVLEESVPIGDLLHEEIGDVVVDVGEADDDSDDNVLT